MLSLVFTFLGLAFAESKSMCPTQPLGTEAMNPVDIRLYLENNASKIKSIDDFFCCLPEEYRKNPQVAYHSIAGQEGNIKSPRVFLNNKIGLPRANSKPDDTKSLEMILSINGGDPKLSQASNIEILFDNKKIGEAELYDIDFLRDKERMSGKNPKNCMGCHGTNGENSYGGPKTIFPADEHWGNFINGVTACTDSERRLLQAVRYKVMESLEANSRFKCIDFSDFFEKPPLSADTQDLKALDRSLTQINDRRVAKLIRQTPDYEHFKYVTFAKTLNLCHDPIEAWIPPEVLSEMTQMDGLLPLSRRSDLTLDEKVSSLWQAQLNKNEEMAKKQNAVAQQIEAGKSPSIEIDDNKYACPGFGTPANQKKNFKNIVTPHRFDTKNQTYHNYILDSLIRAPRGFAGPTPFFRYIFESRGIDTEAWGMAPSKALSEKDGKGALIELLTQEKGRLKKDPFIEKISKMIDHQFEVKSFSERMKDCEELRKQSLSSLKNMHRIKTQRVADPRTPKARD